jgi:hypothetical protein
MQVDGFGAGGPRLGEMRVYGRARRRLNALQLPVRPPEIPAGRRPRRVTVLSPVGAGPPRGEARGARTRLGARRGAWGAPEDAEVDDADGKDAEERRRRDGHLRQARHAAQHAARDTQQKWRPRILELRRRVQLVREGGTRRVQLVREGGTRRVQLVREGGGGLRGPSLLVMERTLPSFSCSGRELPRLRRPRGRP